MIVTIDADEVQCDRRSPCANCSKLNASRRVECSKRKKKTTLVILTEVKRKGKFSFFINTSNHMASLLFRTT